MNKIKNQHGDVLLKSVKKIPDTAKKITCQKGFVLERGEGVHTHVILDNNNVDVYQDNETLYLNVLKDLRIDHEEHGIQVVEKGLYVKDIEVEYDPFEEAARRVID